MAEITSKSSAKQEIKSWWVPAFLGAAVLIFGMSGWAWWHYVWSNPERAFFASLENSLRTQGVSRRIEQTSSGQKLDQRVSLALGSEQLAHGQTTVSQEGEVNASIKTETLSSPKGDYVRYTGIETTQKNKDGKPLDFSQLLNVWGKSSAEGGQGGDLYNESVLGVVPVGNLKAADRQGMMKLIHDQHVYTINPDKIKREIKSGRPVYTYEVTVRPEAYITMLKQFGKAVGLKQLESVDPGSYKDTEPLTFEVSVDVWSHQLSAISFGGGERTEKLSSYGVAQHVDLPKDAMPLEELQSRLQAVQ